MALSCGQRVSLWNTKGNERGTAALSLDNASICVHYAPVRHGGLSLAISGFLVLGATSCSQDESSREHCGSGAKCAPTSFVNSKQLTLMCMAVLPAVSSVGTVVDSGAAIDFDGRRTPTIARAAIVDGTVAPEFFILTPAEPTCSPPTSGAPASAVAFDPSSYSAATLDKILRG